jgi:hypothetical protein
VFIAPGFAATNVTTDYKTIRHRPLCRARWFWKSMVTLLGIGVLSGCGDGRPPLMRVSGRVLIDGQPVEHGYIRVHPSGYRAASGVLGPEGRFHLTTYQPGDGCVAGRHAVTVNALEVINARSQRWHAPKFYRDEETSDLMVEVVGPTDAIEIELTWGGKKPFVETIRGARE